MSSNSPACTIGIRASGEAPSAPWWMRSSPLPAPGGTLSADIETTRRRVACNGDPARSIIAGCGEMPPYRSARDISGADAILYPDFTPEKGTSVATFEHGSRSISVFRQMSTVASLEQCPSRFRPEVWRTCCCAVSNIQLSRSINSASIVPASIRRRASVIGRRKRLRPALPGLR